MAAQASGNPTGIKWDSGHKFAVAEFSTGRKVSGGGKSREELLEAVAHRLSYPRALLAEGARSSGHKGERGARSPRPHSAFLAEAGRLAAHRRVWQPRRRLERWAAQTRHRLEW